MTLFEKAGLFCNRYSPFSIKFISCRTALVKVRLRNRGQDAFKPDVYGDSIVIERRIYATGQTAFQIKNANGNYFTTLSKIADK